MFLKKKISKKNEKREVINFNSSDSITPIYFSGDRIEKSKRKLSLISGILIFVIGIAILSVQSYGYNVYYDGKSIGFVDEPQVVLDNIDEIDRIISNQKDQEAVLCKDDFTFKKGFRYFHVKEDLKDIAIAANEKCDIDVNVYNIYIDDVLVAQDSSIDNYEAAINEMKDYYTDTHDEDDYCEIGFTKKVEVRVSKGSETQSMTFDEMRNLLNSSVEIKTTSYAKVQTTVPYGIIYEATNVKNAGETEVKSVGVEGVVETTKLIEKHNGVEVASTDVASEVLVEKVDQVVLVGTGGLALNASGMLSPTRGTLTSRMGARWGRMHKGIDIAGNLNEPIVAPLEGTVIAAEANGSGYGNMIKIDHGGGVVTLYGHLNQINVNVGDKVHCGQVIGLMGNTGRSTGTHLHFEVIVNGENVDPLYYVTY